MHLFKKIFSRPFLLRLFMMDHLCAQLRGDEQVVCIALRLWITGSRRRSFASWPPREPTTLPKYRNHSLESQAIVVSLSASRSVYFQTSSASVDADSETDGEGSGHASTSGAAQLDLHANFSGSKNGLASHSVTKISPYVRWMIN